MTDFCYVEISSIFCDHIDFFSLKSILVYTTTNSPQFFSSESKTWRCSCQRMVNSCTCTVCMWLDNLPHLPQHIDLCWHKKQSQSLNRVAFILPKIWVYRNLWNTEKLALLIPDPLIFVLKPNMPITGMNALVQFSDLWLVFYHFKIKPFIHMKSNDAIILWGFIPCLLQ